LAGTVLTIGTSGDLKADGNSLALTVTGSVKLTGNGVLQTAAHASAAITLAGTGSITAGGIVISGAGTVITVAANAAFLAADLATFAANAVTLTGATTIVAGDTDGVTFGTGKYTFGGIATLDTRAATLGSTGRDVVYTQGTSLVLGADTGGSAALTVGAKANLVTEDDAVTFKPGAQASTVNTNQKITFKSGAKLVAGDGIGTTAADATVIAAGASGKGYSDDTTYTFTADATTSKASEASEWVAAIKVNGT
jgi:hypothetical protein